MQEQLEFNSLGILMENKRYGGTDMVYWCIYQYATRQ